MQTRYTDAQKEQAISLRKKGYLLQAIADKVGIKNLTTIRNICFAAGLPKHHNYPPKIIYKIGDRFNYFIIINL